MRRWELVGGGSAKFWEAAVEDALVTVRYGRIGAEGRSQEKELESAEAALVHFDKLVAEKERKGYLEAGSSARQAGSSAPQVGPPAPQQQDVAAAPPLSQRGPEAPPQSGPPDEDTFVLPSSWRRVLHPRRGGVPRGVAAPAADAADRTRGRIRAETHRIEQVLTDPHVDPALVRAARAALAGKPDALGAAALASLVTGRSTAGADDVPFVDAWVAEHGLAFAARAVVEAFDIDSDWQQYARSQGNRALRFRGPTDHIAALSRVRRRTGYGRSSRARTRRPTRRPSPRCASAEPPRGVGSLRPISPRAPPNGPTSASPRSQATEPVVTPCGPCCCAHSTTPRRSPGSARPRSSAGPAGQWP
ncbi:WGR domain-containing protein [Peterkaempfera sp. SMS 1(5)a]|uniref:WGR domain-containing protein n=1 Tax=Peterkaempfera podocarpi TaxID=3232308 RepID=UPI00366DD061